MIQNTSPLSVAAPRRAVPTLFLWLWLVPVLNIVVACSDRGDGEEGQAPHHATSSATSRAHSAERDKVKLSIDAIKNNGIRVESVKQHALRPTVVAPARVAFNTETMAHLGSPLAGRVVDVKVRAGDAVNKGDVLVVIESNQLGEAQSDFLQKRTAAAAAASAIEIARNAYERGKALYEKNEGIALAEVQKREGELRTVQAEADSTRAALTAAQNKLRLLGVADSAVADLTQSGQINPHYRLAAPIDGRVIDRRVTLGDLVAPEKESLLTIADMTTLWVIADVPEAHVGQIHTDAEAMVMVTALPDRELIGAVTFIAPVLEPSTRTAQVRIEVGNLPVGVKPGMSARVAIQAFSNTAGEPVLAIPGKAVLMMEGERCVFVPVAGEEGAFAKRPVSVGNEVGGMVPVLAGLKEADPVVVSGAFILKAELGKGTADEEGD